MAGNLKSRLERIRAGSAGSGRSSHSHESSTFSVPVPRVLPESDAYRATAPLFPPPWTALDPMVLFRCHLIRWEEDSVLGSLLSCYEGKGRLSELSPSFINILFRGGDTPLENLTLQDLLFFDLETTGLSGGAGTVAFLAAFGSLNEQGLEVRQYLLLDYPGEPIFLEYIYAELTKKEDRVLVSYNGKAFDIQILRNRFALQGRLLRDQWHIDLLYISRLLWSGLLPSCSLGTLETQVLNRKREGDIPGALAPQIWFDFLREGPRGSALEKLQGVCDHNVLDIEGLSSLFGMVLRIGSDPVGAIEQRAFHLDRLALLWPEEETRLLLLQEAALRGSLRARYELARIARRSGEWERYRSLMEDTADEKDSVSESGMVPRGTVLLWRLRANIQLASYYEWKARDYEAALIRTRRAAALLAELSAERLKIGAKAASPSINMKLEERLNRLLAKQQNGGLKR